MEGAIESGIRSSRQLLESLRAGGRGPVVGTAAAKSPRRELGSLYEPRSIAVVGASADPMKWGHWMARDALDGARGAACTWSTRAEGRSSGSGPTLGAELPESPDLVVLAVPESRFEEARRTTRCRPGARALLVITAGFAEERRGGPRPRARGGRAGARRRAR